MVQYPVTELNHFCYNRNDVIKKEATDLICPYCNSQIPDGIVECFVCGENLLPKNTSNYYTDMDAIKEEDEELYDKVSKDMGIPNSKRLTDGQIIALIITGAIALILLNISLDTFKFIKYKCSSNYEKRQAVVVGLHCLSATYEGQGYLCMDCIVTYEFNGELREEQLKAGMNYALDDVITIYTDMDGNAYHFVFSLGDMLQIIIILSLSALAAIAIIRWHVMPNADGHLNTRMPAIGMMERRSPGLRSRGGKWWRYF